MNRKLYFIKNIKNKNVKIQLSDYEWTIYLYLCNLFKFTKLKLVKQFDLKLISWYNLSIIAE